MLAQYWSLNGNICWPTTVRRCWPNIDHLVQRKSAANIGPLLAYSFSLAPTCRIKKSLASIWPNNKYSLGSPIRCLLPNELETYLGVPIGACLTFRATTSIIELMDKVATSLLAPWQKLEVLRAHLLPSLSHFPATGRAPKETLRTIDEECCKYLRLISCTPESCTLSLFYFDRRVGGLGMSTLREDSDVWTVARATQLLGSNDPTVRSVSWAQLRLCIRKDLPLDLTDQLPVAEFLSGSKDAGLYRLRNGSCPTTTTWSLARKAAARLKIQLDESGEQINRIVTDDVAVLPPKAVKGLRLAVRQRLTTKFTSMEHQGRVAAGLALDSSKDTARIVAGRGGLCIVDLKLLHRSPLDLLPLHGYS